MTLFVCSSGCLGWCPLDCFVGMLVGGKTKNVTYQSEPAFCCYVLYVSRFPPLVVQVCNVKQFSWPILAENIKFMGSPCCHCCNRVVSFILLWLWFMWCFSVLRVEQKLVHTDVITDIKLLWVLLLLLFSIVWKYKTLVLQYSSVS